jgi:hypothetical protein
MRKTTNNLAMILFFIFAIIACESNPTIHPSISFGRLVSHSPCKSGKTTDLNTDSPDTVSCIEYSFNAATKKLSLTHVNAGFNCCPGELSCDVSLSGDTIIIHEEEETPMCDCDCLYDLEIEIDSVSEAVYRVKFIEPYVGDQARLEFEIDLTRESSDTYCVVRTQYPWIAF